MSAPPQPPSHDTAQPKVRLGAIILALLLIPVNSYWIVRSEAMDYSGFPTIISLFYNVIFSIMVLLVSNMVARKVAPKLALNQWELLVVYAMVATGSSFAGHDYLQMLVPSLAHHTVFGTSFNHWHEMVSSNLPDWMAINHDSEAVRAFERGHSTLYRWDHIKIWLVPMGTWGIFLMCTAMATLSICVLLRRQWIENEKLSFPIVQIPLLITEEGGAGPIFKSKLFWIGFAIAAYLDIHNGLAALVPTIPAIMVKQKDIGTWVTFNAPWNAIGPTNISFYPFAIGLSYFMPTNLAFSSWFFFWVRKLQQVACSSLGWSGLDANMPYVKEQSFGALMVIVIFALWMSRGHLSTLWKMAWSGAGRQDSEGREYRGALVMLGASLLGMVLFLAVGGMSWWVAVLYVTLYILLCTSIGRIRAELGAPAHEFGSMGSSHMMVYSLGSTLLGPHNLTILGILWFQNRMYRGLLMPQQVECLKAAHHVGMKPRYMVGVLAAAAFVGILAGYWALLHHSYARILPAYIHPGAPGSAFAAEYLIILNSWMGAPIEPKVANMTAIGVGAAITLLLTKLSMIWHGNPFHPAGYALGMAFGLDYIWCPIMISWALKSFILRIYGLKGYRWAMPFFVGLVLGEFAVGGLWSCIRGLSGIPTYSFYL